MLSMEDLVRKTVSWIMGTGCWLRVFPYSWDPNKFQLGAPSKAHLLVYYGHTLGMSMMWIFAVTRLLTTMDMDIPPRIRILSTSWVFAETFFLICAIQFVTKHEEILHLANGILKYLKEKGIRTKKDQ